MIYFNIKFSNGASINYVKNYLNSSPAFIDHINKNHSVDSIYYYKPVISNGALYDSRSSIFTNK
jgi:hypothetical protein